MIAARARIWNLERELTEVSVRWLKKTARFKAHILGLNLFDHRELKRYFYAEVGGKPVAFITCIPITAATASSSKDAIRDPHAPYGVIELITLTIIDDSKAACGKMLTFGISPDST